MVTKLRRIVLLLTIVLLLVAMVVVVVVVVYTGVAFGAAAESASCLGVQRSNAEKGDVGRFSRETAGEELFGHKGQKEVALLGRATWEDHFGRHSRD